MALTKEKPYVRQWDILVVRHTYLDKAHARCNSAVLLQALDKHLSRMTDCYISLTWIDNRNCMIWNKDHRHSMNSSLLQLMQEFVSISVFLCNSYVLRPRTPENPRTAPNTLPKAHTTTANTNRKPQTANRKPQTANHHPTAWMRVEICPLKLSSRENR